MALFENPEDLGAIESGEHRGVRPASMWQWDAFQTLLQQQFVETIAFYQQDFGTEYLKPTRLLLATFSITIHPSARVSRPSMIKVSIRDHSQHGSQHGSSWDTQVWLLRQQVLNSGHRICADG